MRHKTPRLEGYYDPVSISSSSELPPVQAEYQATHEPKPKGHPVIRTLLIIFAVPLIFAIGAGLVIGYWELVGSKPGTPKVVSPDKTATNFNGDSGATNSGSASDAKSRDAERQADIKALSQRIEQYYSSNSYYPTLNNLNDVTWLKANMPDLDKETFRDPKSTIYIIASAPTGNAYSYQPLDESGATCDNLDITTDCVSYTLLTSLEAGGTFTKTNPN